MNENHDGETGQFAPSEQPLLTGQAGIEHEAGYVPYQPEEKEKDDGELTVAEAAEQLAESMPESEVRTYSPLDDLPANVTLTVEQGAKLLSDQLAAERADAAEKEAAQIRKEVDELRGTEQETAKEPAFDPEKALEHPQVKEAIERVTRETVEAREKHVNGLAAATSIAEQSILGKYPELMNIAPEQRLSAFAAIAQNDPERAAAIQADIMSLANVYTQYTAENERLTAERQQQYSNYAKAESDRFEAMIASTPKADRTAIESNIVEAIKEYGGDVDQFVRLMRGSEFASATVQRLLWDVGKYRAILKAPKAVAAKPIPKVQRPGVAVARSSDDDIGALDRELTRTGDIKVALRLHAAQQRRAKG